MNYRSDSFEALHHDELSNHPANAAYELYYQLRQADQSSAEVILIELPPDTPA